MSEVAANAEKPAAKAEEKKEEGEKVFVYKGEIVDASTLAGAGVVACEIPDVQVPEIKTGGWGGQAATKLPKLIFVTSIQESPLNKKSCLLNYVSYLSKKHPFQVRAISVPNDFKVKKLTGKQATKMLDAYQKFEFDNLHTVLGHDFQIGSAPETFVEDAAGKIVPAFTFLGSAAEKKDTTRQKKAVYWNGSQAGMETVPGGCLAFHVDSIQEGLETIYKAAKKVNNDAKPTIKSVMEVTSDVLQSATDEQAALASACENVYGLKAKDVPARELPFRATCGAIHFGIGTKSDEQVKQMVRALDSILAVCCVSLFAKYDNPVRRQFFGLAGSYRTSKFGLEYLTLSNAVICHPMITHLTFDLARKCVVFGAKGLLKFWDSSEEETLTCVQNSDVELAHKIMERNRPTLMKIFRAAYSYLSDKQLDNAYHIFYDGMDAAIKNPADIVSNWKLDGGWVVHSGADSATCGAGMQKVAHGGHV